MDGNLKELTYNIGEWETMGDFDDGPYGIYFNPSREEDDNKIIGYRLEVTIEWNLFERISNYIDKRLYAVRDNKDPWDYYIYFPTKTEAELKRVEILTNGIKFEYMKDIKRGKAMKCDIFPVYQSNFYCPADEEDCDWSDIRNHR